MKQRELNKEQKEAVAFGQGPILIVAGAGTGKTAVITERIAHLIKKGKAKPEEILALTFTEKAAEEMEDRVNNLLTLSYSDLWISTFHSFSNRILEENGLDIGLSTDYKLINETSAWLLIKQNFDKFKLDYYRPRGNPTKFIHSLITHFSRCKDQGIYPEDYLKYKGEDEKRIKEVAEAYNTYQNLLLENNLLDFGDLINYSIELFKKRPLILNKYRKQFKYILVDEFQDTNWAQYELVKMIAFPDNNLTACADDDQAIYRFRGASFSNILQFKKDFKDAKEIFLVNNYRSTQDILDASHKFITLNNPNRLEYIIGTSKRLLSSKKEKGAIEHLHFKTLDQELEGVIRKIIEIKNKNTDLSFSDFAVLSRANDSANAFLRACERAGVPCQFLASKGLYSKPVILDIISYFKVLDNYHEDSSLYRVLNLPFLEIPFEDIAKITQYGYKKGHSVYESLKELALISKISKKASLKISGIMAMIKSHSELAKEKNASKVFLAFLQDSGYLKYLQKLDRKEEFDYINQFSKKIKSFEEENIDARLNNFINHINLELEAGEEGSIDFDIDMGPDMVKIMTVHSAKGLEFNYVFVINMVDRKFPVLSRKDPIEIPEGLIKDIIPNGDFHLEEERRLFYVAMTRAKKGLFFSSAEDYGGKQRKKLSRFLLEMGYKEKLILEREKEIVRIPLSKKKAYPLPLTFSFTQLSSFKTCPLQYKFSSIFRIPVRGKAVFSFGRTMHNTLFDFMKEKGNLNDLLDIYNKRWIDEWYDSKSQKEDYFKAGKEALKAFYNNFISKKPEILFIGDNPALEKDFTLKVGDYVLRGKIDRIDKAGKGVEIVDYKTGEAKEKLGEDDREQLLIYQIAAEESFGLNPEKLTYYYLDEGKELNFIGSEKDKEKQKEKIISTIKEIEKSEFKANPGWHCKFCDYRDICEFKMY